MRFPTMPCRFAVGLALALAAIAASHEAPASEPGSLQDDIRAVIRAEHEAGRFDGVALVARGDTILGEFAFGQANRTFRVAHQVNEPFPVASVTKQWLAVMILQLVDQKRLALEDPLSRHLPEVDRPWAQKVTIQQLLSHTSGLPQPDESIPDYYTRPDLAPSAIALARLLSTKEPAGPAGEKFSYNNADYVYLSAVIEKIQGTSLAEAFRIMIAVPARLNSTGIVEGREIIADFPTAYEVEAGRVRVAGHFELANFQGAGAGYSTLRDLWAIDRALMANSLLKPETTALMLDSSPQSGYAGLGCWIYPSRFDDGKALRIVERHGAIGGYNVVNLYVPETKVVIVLASNVSSFADPQTWNKQGLAYQILKLVAKAN